MTLACPNAHAALSQRPVQLLAGCHPAMSIQWPSSSLMAMRKARCPSASPSCAKLNPVGLSTTTFPTRIIVGRHSAWSATPAPRNRCHSQTLGSEFAKNSSRTLWCIKEASRMPTSQSEELAVDARQRRADTSSPQEPAHDRIGEEGLIATPFEQWKVCGKQSSASRARARFGVGSCVITSRPPRKRPGFLFGFRLCSDASLEAKQASYEGPAQG